MRGKTVVVTGASGGIGRAIARALRKEGCRLALHAHENAGKLRDEFPDGEDVRCYAADLTDVKAAKTFAEKVAADFGPVYGLVNNAGGVFGAAEADRIDEAGWDATFALNAKAPYFLFQALASHFTEGDARIINVSSIAARYGGSPVTLHYACAKAAVETLTLGLAKWGAPRGILVNTIQPGMVDTEFHERLGRTREMLEERAELILLKRMGKPEDVASMALFLLSERASFITGQTFVVSGGD